MTFEEIKPLIMIHLMEVPEWARYATLNDHGALWVHETKPTINLGAIKRFHWICGSVKRGMYAKRPSYETLIHVFNSFNGDEWKETLIDIKEIMKNA